MHKFLIIALLSLIMLFLIFGNLQAISKAFKEKAPAGPSFWGVWGATSWKLSILFAIMGLFFTFGEGEFVQAFFLALMVAVIAGLIVGPVLGLVPAIAAGLAANFGEKTSKWAMLLAMFSEYVFLATCYFVYG